MSRPIHFSPPFSLLLSPYLFLTSLYLSPYLFLSSPLSFYLALSISLLSPLFIPHPIYFCTPNFYLNIQTPPSHIFASDLLKCHSYFSRTAIEVRVWNTQDPRAQRKSLLCLCYNLSSSLSCESTLSSR